MSKQRDRSCPTGKARFTPEAAERWLADYRRRKPPRAPRMRAYACALCGGTHVTKRAQWKSSSVHARRKGVSW